MYVPTSPQGEEPDGLVIETRFLYWENGYWFRKDHLIIPPVVTRKPLSLHFPHPLRLQGTALQGVSYFSSAMEYHTLREVLPAATKAMIAEVGEIYWGLRRRRPLTCPGALPSHMWRTLKM